MATAREDLQLKLATPGQKDRKQLLEYIEKGQIGYDATLQGPFGSRQGVYLYTIMHCKFIICYVHLGINTVLLISWLKVLPFIMLFTVAL